MVDGCMENCVHLRRKAVIGLMAEVKVVFIDSI